jgi:hypothetical protein
MLSSTAATNLWPNDIRRVISISMQFEACGQPGKGIDSPFRHRSVGRGQLALYDHLEADGRWRLQERWEHRYPMISMVGKISESHLLAM